MSHKDTITSYLAEYNGFYCDDCLSKLCNIIPRQTVFQVCTQLNINKKINRNLGTCSQCGKQKKVNSMINDTYRSNIYTNKTKKIDHSSNPIIKSQEKIIYDNKFIEVNLEFEKFNIKDTFSRYSAHTLAEILIKSKYEKLNYECNKYYQKYMGMEIGAFLGKLKQDNNAFYKKFLNPYGDQLYCKYKMEANSLEKCKGLYLYKNNGCIKYIGRVKGNFDFYQRINAGYANISPKNCYIDGQATNCHINSLINAVGDGIKFYIMPLKDDQEICFLERKLIKENKPEWNIALK